WPVPAQRDDIGPVDDETAVAVAGGRLARALQSFERGFVLVLDNAHWGDAPSMDALRFACRRLVTARVLVIVVHQPAGATTDVAPRSVSPGLHAGWRAVFESPEGARIQLGGLTAAELLELAAASGHPGLNPPAAARLHTHTGGSPFH